MDKQYRLPAIIIITTPILAIVWYVVNTDTIGSVLFGEKLDHCSVIACEVTRNRFFPVLGALCIAFIVGLGLLLYRSFSGGKNAKN